ncbi:START domain-containing proteins involved in steroidogenesis/phosphatidylcholine transfer protein [Dioscorea alata]|uniref:START domain-containing proteins involved in steroidogenesis/phosphatidylcholine transfer protein n=2 Tax=Dioscorea alata TaxID=55571 RepID=A0ACB7WIR1_DIOAL|nr:START domain-containing proteins involved in steroidogenesis/phosphatidylcholine transfer protein [Dioscorea alata]
MAVELSFLSQYLAGTSAEFWREKEAGGWATVLVVLFLFAYHFSRSFYALCRRSHLSANPESPMVHRPLPKANSNSSSGISKFITEGDLRDLISGLEGKLNDGERWEDVIEKKNGHVTYMAKSCRPKDGPLKYLSVTRFEKCSTELLRDFYMDNEYRKEWDKTVIEHKQLDVDETSGTEIGLTLKKFPFLTAREYVLAWRVWEGDDKTFYCLIKDCDHPLAPRQKKFVRVRSFISGWRIKKVPGRDACEVTVVHQEDAGMNTEMAKLVFAKGIWSYVCKMSNALHEYSSRNRKQSSSVSTLLKIIKKVPPEVQNETEIENPERRQLSNAASTSNYKGRLSNPEKCKSSHTSTSDHKGTPLKKWVNRLLLIGGIVCLSRGRSALGTQVAMAVVLKQLMKGQVDPAPAPAPAPALRV